MPGAVGLDTVSEGNNNIGSDFFRHQSFQSFQFGGDLDSATSDSVVNHFGSGQYTSGHINTGFECQPYFSKKDDGRASPRQLVLRPGHQIVPMFFNARAVGEYAPLFISLQIGKVLLVERIDADVNKLHNFFDSNTLISIIKPTDPIGLSILVPPLCPIGYKDSVLVGVELEEKDELHNVEMSVYSVLLDKQFIQSLTLVEDAIERDFLISQYIEAAGDSWLFADDGGQNGAISVETRHAQIDNLVNQYLSPSTGALTETKVLDALQLFGDKMLISNCILVQMLPGTSPRAPLARRPTSHITRDLSNRATGNGDSYDGTIKYGLFVSKPNTWQMCDTTGVHPPRAASVLGRNNLLASAHPKTDIRIIDKVKDTRELIISVPIAAAPLVKQSSDSNNSITVDLPGADDTSILSRSAFPDECFAIVCKIQGRLLRNSCETDFDCQTHSILQCGVPVSISQESVGSIDKEFFHQCVIKNRSNVSFSLNSIRVRSWTAGVPCPRIDLINDDICDLKEITVATSKMRGTSREWNDAGEHSLSLGLFLRPLDSYFFAARFSEQLYVPPPVKHNRLFDFGGGRNSPVGAIDNSVKPSVVNFYLGRPRSQWISGNANLFCIDGSITTGDSPKSIPAYFKEFFETYDPDMFGFIVSVFAPEPAPQDLIQLSTQKENPYPMPNYADNALSPVISTNTITSEVNIKLMFPHYCSVTAELVADVRLKPIPLGSGAGYMQARMGFPIKCSYRINLEYMGGKFSNIANLEKCNMTRLMLASVCETDVWLPVGSVSESFELMSISAMLNSRRIVNKVCKYLNTVDAHIFLLKRIILGWC